MARTLVMFEKSASLALVDSAHPTALMTPSYGTVFGRPYGPKQVGDAGNGWSFDLRAGYGGFTIGNNYNKFLGIFAAASFPGATLKGQYGKWVRFDGRLGPDNFEIRIARVIAAAGLALSIWIDPITAVVRCERYFGGSFINDSPLTLTFGKWYWFGIAWELTAGVSINYKYLYRALGDSSDIVLVSGTSVSTAATSVTQCWMQNEGAASNTTFAGRVGGITVHSLGTIADAGYPTADVVPPPAGPNAWYVSSVTGATTATHDGTTLATAWDAATVIEEVKYCTLLGCSYGLDGALTKGGNARTGAGDILYIDERAPLVLTTPWSMYNSLARGIHVRPVSETLRATITDRVTLTGWSQPDAITYPNLWAAAVPTADVAILEGDTYLSHPASASLATINSTAGSFRINSTIAQIHTSDGTNPNTNGRTYQRTTRLSTNGDSPGVTGGLDTRWTRIQFDGFALVQPDNSARPQYCTGTLVGDSNTVYSHCEWAGGSNHQHGNTGLCVNRVCTISNSVGHEAPEWMGDRFVDFSAGGGMTGNRSYYDNLAFLGENGAAWLTHGTAASSWDVIDFTDVDFGGLVVHNNEQTYADGGLTFTFVNVVPVGLWQISFASVAGSQVIFDTRNLIASPSPAEVDVDHDTGGTDNLRVVDPDGNGVSGALVEAFASGDTVYATPIDVTITDDDGHWIVPMKLQPGSYMFRATALNYFSATDAEEVI